MRLRFRFCRIQLVVLVGQEGEAVLFFEFPHIGIGSHDRMDWKGDAQALVVHEINSFLKFFVLLAQEDGEVKELISGEVIELAASDFFFEALSLVLDAVEIILERGEEFFSKIIAFKRAGGIDFPVEFAVPPDKGRLGDAETVGDASKAPALAAEGHEVVFGVFGVHMGVDYWMIGLVD